MAVVTNDIYTTEDAKILLREAVLPADRVVAVQTGCCPHTAIRDDISANLEAVESLEDAHPDLDLVLVESGGITSPPPSATAWCTPRSSSSTWPEGTRSLARAAPGSRCRPVSRQQDRPGAVRKSRPRHNEHDDSAARPERPFIFLSLVEDPMARPVAAWLERQLKAQCVPELS